MTKPITDLEGRMEAAMKRAASQMGKRGAAATNKILTTEGRRKAAKLGWKRLKAKRKLATTV